LTTPAAPLYSRRPIRYFRVGNAARQVRRGRETP